MTEVIKIDSPSGMWAEVIADAVIREVSELPDRTSPEDQPGMMLVTADELRAIVMANLEIAGAMNGDRA